MIYNDSPTIINIKKEKLLSALKCIYYVANNQTEFKKQENFTIDQEEIDLHESLNVVKEFILKIENESE